MDGLKTKLKSVHDGLSAISGKAALAFAGGVGAIGFFTHAALEGDEAMNKLRFALEATPVVQRLAEDDQIAKLDRPDLYVYCWHGGNTWGNDHFDRQIARGSGEASPDDYPILRDVLGPITSDPCSAQGCIEGSGTEHPPRLR